jgi:hypothetical protein
MLHKVPRVQERQELIRPPCDEEDPRAVSGKYQAESPVKYEGRCCGQAGPVIVAVFDILWLMYNMYLIAQAAACVALLNQTEIIDVVKNQVGVPGANSTTVDLQPIITNTDWVIVLSVADGWAFGWLVWAVIVGGSNCRAVLAFRKEATAGSKLSLPFPPLLLSVTWSIFIFILWSIVLGGAVYYYYYTSSFSELFKVAGFLGLMFVVILFGIISSVLGFCRRLRDLYDVFLRCCKCPCHDC